MTKREINALASAATIVQNHNREIINIGHNNVHMYKGIDKMAKQLKIPLEVQYLQFSGLNNHYKYYFVHKGVTFFQLEEKELKL